MAAISEAHATVKKKGGRASKKTANLKTALTVKHLHTIPGKPAGPNTPPLSIPLPLDSNTMVLGLRPATAYT